MICDAEEAMCIAGVFGGIDWSTDRVATHACAAFDHIFCTV